MSLNDDLRVELHDDFQGNYILLMGLIYFTSCLIVLSFRILARYENNFIMYLTPCMNRVRVDAYKQGGA